MLLCIIERREISFQGSDGGQIEGYMYGALTEDGKLLQFFSRDSSHEPNEKLLKFNRSEAVELNVSSRLGTDKHGNVKRKWREDEE